MGLEGHSIESSSVPRGSTMTSVKCAPVCVLVFVYLCVHIQYMCVGFDVDICVCLCVCVCVCVRDCVPCSRELDAVH